MRTADLETGKVYAYCRGRIDQYTKPERTLLLDTRMWRRGQDDGMRVANSRRACSGWRETVGLPVLWSRRDNADPADLKGQGLVPDGPVPDGWRLDLVSPRELHPLSVFDEIARQREAERMERLDAERRMAELRDRVAAAWAVINAGTGVSRGAPLVGTEATVTLRVDDLEVIAARLTKESDR